MKYCVGFFLLAFFVACGEDNKPTSFLSPDTSAPNPSLGTVDSFIHFRDLETGSLWNIKGEAVQGELRGQRLAQVPAYQAYWFAWASFWPNTSVWGEGETDGLMPAGVFGAVPADEIIPDLAPDAIPPLDDPKKDWGQAKFVDDVDYLDGTDIVIGFVLDGDAHAYPVGILNFHEIVNHTVGGQKVSVTYCPLTASGIVFDGEAIAFGNTGALYNNNMVMYDRATNSFWAQMGLGSIAGSRVGERLKVLPVMQTTWATWKALYPNTKVLAEDTGYRRFYRTDYYIDSEYTINRNIGFPQAAPIDTRYHPKAMVLGIVGEMSTRAYVHEKMAQREVVNDVFEGRQVLVVYDREAVLARAFDRVVDGQVLTFELAE